MTSPSLPLQGRVALITGALGDIGRAVSVELSARGAALALGDVRPPADGARFVAELEARGHAARYDDVDVSDRAAVEAWCARVARDAAAPDIVVANAGIVVQASLMELSTADWRRVMGVNLEGVWNTVRAAAAVMLAHGRAGHVVIVGSIAAHLPSRAIPAYCVSKAALRMLCQCFALELGPHGIRVNELAPGNVDAGMSARVLAADPAAAADALRRTPLNTLISVDEVARQVALLCDPGQRTMTGATVVVDGGYSLHGGA